MKTALSLVLIIALLIYFQPLSAQQGEKTDLNKAVQFKVGINYQHAYTLHGHVRVREFDLIGDVLEWEQLGLKNYSIPGFNLQTDFGKKHQIRFQFDQLYFKSKGRINRNIAYNGTIINGREGIDLSPSTFKRLKLEYRRKLITSGDFEVWGIGGFIFEYFTIYLKSTVSPLSERNEVYEAFQRQAYPYPFLGANGTKELGKQSQISFTIRGTYIPKFKSHFDEGGRVYLKYHTLIANLDYQYQWNRFYFNSGIFYRSMYLMGDSPEDTNEFSISSVGLGIGLSYLII